MHNPWDAHAALSVQGLNAKRKDWQEKGTHMRSCPAPHKYCVPTPQLTKDSICSRSLKTYQSKVKTH